MLRPGERRRGPGVSGTSSSTPIQLTRTKGGQMFGVWLELSPWGPAGAGARGLRPCVSDSLGLAGQLEVPLGPVKSSFLQKQEVLCRGCKQTHLRLQSCLGRRVGGRVSPSDISLSSLLPGPSQWQPEVTSIFQPACPPLAGKTPGSGAG